MCRVAQASAQSTVFFSVRAPSFKARRFIHQFLTMAAQSHPGGVASFLAVSAAAVGQQGNGGVAPDVADAGGRGLVPPATLTLAQFYEKCPALPNSDAALVKEALAKMSYPSEDGSNTR